MSRKIFEVTLYEPVGLLGRETFYVFAKNPWEAAAILKRKWPKAKPLVICKLFG